MCHRWAVPFFLWLRVDFVQLVSFELLCHSGFCALLKLILRHCFTEYHKISRNYSSVRKLWINQIHYCVQLFANLVEHQLSNIEADSGCVSVYSLPDNCLPRNCREWISPPPTRIKETEPTGGCWEGGGIELRSSRIAQSSRIARAAEQHEQHVSSAVAAWSDQEWGEGIKYPP